MSQYRIVRSDGETRETDSEREFDYLTSLLDEAGEDYETEVLGE